MAERLPPVLLVGGGKMGQAMLAGWAERGIADSVVVDPHGAPGLARPGWTVLAEPPPDFRPEVVIFAIKPQQAEVVAPLYRRYARSAMILSIMAGWTLHGLNALFKSDLAGDGAGVDPAIIRAMPNTPSAIRQGMTVAVASANVSEDRRALASALLEAVGDVAWVTDETLLEPVTAISGGGPAYVFLLAELLEQIGVARGLPPGLARQMARRTVAGSGALLAASDDDCAVLRKAVTSPGGTTEQALRVLMADDAWPSILAKAMDAAIARSREIGR